MGSDAIEMVRCKRCGYEWYPRTPKLPTVCPSCHSPYWMKERRISNGGGE